MHRINTKSALLSNHCGNYNQVDARLDNPHVPASQLGRIVREVRMEQGQGERAGRYRPLRARLRAA